MLHNRVKTIIWSDHYKLPSKCVALLHINTCPHTVYMIYNIRYEYEIWGFHSGGNNNEVLLGFGAM